MHRDLKMYCDLYINDSCHKYISLHNQMDIGMYKCKIHPSTKISFANTFLFHTQMCHVLNEYNVYYVSIIYELKKYLQFSSKNLFGCWYIYNIQTLKLEFTRHFSLANFWDSSDVAG